MYVCTGIDGGYVSAMKLGGGRGPLYTTYRYGHGLEWGYHGCEVCIDVHIIYIYIREYIYVDFTSPPLSTYAISFVLFRIVEWSDGRSRADQPRSGTATYVTIDLCT